MEVNYFKLLLTTLQQGKIAKIILVDDCRQITIRQRNLESKTKTNTFYS